MKTIISALLVAAVLVAVSFIYPACMEVVAVDRAADLVTFETSTGHLYAMTGAEDWQRGDLAALLMWSAGTLDDVTDDVILTARASGFFRECPAEQAKKFFPGAVSIRDRPRRYVSEIFEIQTEVIK